MKDWTLEQIMRAIAKGERNELGDLWSTHWCENAANELAALRAQRDELIDANDSLKAQNTDLKADVSAMRLAAHVAELEYRAQRDELEAALRGMLQGQEYKTIAGIADWHQRSIPRKEALSAARAAIAKLEVKP